MIGFNMLLKDEGVDPVSVKLVRHQDTRYPGRPSPYQLWLANDGRLDLYQEIQKRPVFKGATWLASFVVTPLDETLFVGLYANNGEGKAEPGLKEPISEKDVGASKYCRYTLEQSHKLAGYRGRLIIEWGRGKHSWVQWAGKNDKPVIEIRRVVGDPPFPGFLDFRASLSGLAAVPLSWRAALSSVTGVYLLTCPDTGKQYVGSAQGVGGFWGRWEDYVASGHGGNKLMKEIPASDYQVCVLEVASSSAGSDVIAKMETRWKLKLLSRTFGLNAN